MGRTPECHLPTPVLFNDVYFESSAPRVGATWFCFPRLPGELRQLVWLQYLQQHRMVDIDIWPPGEFLAVDPNARYTRRNHRGRIVSDSGYKFALRGPGSYAGSLSPLLRVNREARDVALTFYHVRLPFPGREQVLYMNSALDVIHMRPTLGVGEGGERGFLAALLDFLHDARAYDVKDQGISHLMLNQNYQFCLLTRGILPPVVSQTAADPALIHPAAAATFADILRSRLRSLFLVVGGFESWRSLPSTYLGPTREHGYHFAQTIPHERKGLATGSFRWLDTDPRPGVEFDLRRVWVPQDPRGLIQAWKRLEDACGITKEDRAARAGVSGGGSNVHICLTQHWHDTRRNAEEDVWSRDALAWRFRYDVDRWLATPLDGRGDGSGPDARLLEYSSKPQRDDRVSSGATGTQLTVPRDAIGMWTVPAQVFEKPADPPHDVFNLHRVASGTRPGLLLFEVP